MENENLLERIKEILHRLELRETRGNNRNSLKARLNMLLTEYCNLGNDIDFIAVDYPIIKEINIYKTDKGNKSVVVNFQPNFKYKESSQKDEIEL